VSPRRARAVTAAAGVGGAAVLRFALTAKPGSSRFYVASLGTAGVWTAGAVASGYRVRAGRVGGRGLAPVATGTGAFAVFYGAALVARRIPVLETSISSVLRHADGGLAPLVLTSFANAVGEELFFRGALYAAAGQHPVATSALAYTTVTAATGNPALTLAGAAMGLLFAQQRRMAGGIQAPVMTHVTWSLLMVRFLPRLFPGRPRGARTG
jgi:uncharacterized protein